MNYLAEIDGSVGSNPEIDQYFKTIHNLKTVSSMRGINDEEREMLTVACRKWINILRLTWRRTKVAEIENVGEDLNRLYAQTFKIANCVCVVCETMLNVLNNMNFVQPTSMHTEISILRLKADLLRYKTEVIENHTITKAAHKCLNAYLKVCIVLTSQLNTADPIRVEVPMKFSKLFGQLEIAPLQMCCQAKEFFEKLRNALQCAACKAELTPKLSDEMKIAAEQNRMSRASRVEVMNSTQNPTSNSLKRKVQNYLNPVTKRYYRSLSATARLE